MIWVIIVGLILFLLFIFSLISITPITSQDDEAQLEALQKWKEAQRNA